MCLGIDEVRDAVDEKLAPIREALLDMKKAVESLITIEKKQTELESNITHLLDDKRTRVKFEDELFDRVRAIENDTEPRTSCSAIFGNIERNLEINRLGVEKLEDQTKKRTWAILAILIAAGLSFWGSLLVGIIIYFVKTS